MPVQTEALRQIPLFAHLSPEDLAQVARITVERHYDRGNMILFEGERGGALHFVWDGLIKVFKTSPEGKEQVLRLISPGHTFNDVPALDGGLNPASAAALEPSTVYVIGSMELRRLLEERPTMALQTINALAGALRHLVTLVEDLSFRHVTARVAKILLEREEAAAGGVPAHRLTQSEMAAMAGTAREMVGRALKDLEASGAIEMRQGRAVVIDPEGLRALL